ncbi:MAG: hypothetical protein U5J64_10995 [Halobacteriales archaeon]|nr:hypothetical protein [Halobacteriales archaeon]
MRKIAYIALLAVVLAMVAVSGASAQTPSDSGGDGSGVGSAAGQSTTADTVYVRDNGDAVLVYESPEGETNGSVSYGADMSSGLLHFLAEGTAEDTELTGEMSFVAEPASWNANGSFQTGEIESVEEMNLDVSSSTDRTNSEFNAELDTTLSSQFAAFVSSASTDGEVVVGPDSITSSGNMNYEMGLGGSSVREVSNFDLSGTGGDYTLDVRDRRIVRSQGFEPTDPEEDWGTRERALETLREDYASIAENTSGTAEVTLGSYSFEEVEVDSGFGTSTNESLIDVEYTVEYSGVTDGLADTIMEEDTGVSQETAEEMAQALSDVNINTMRFNTVSGGGSTEANWTVDIENYNDASLAYFRLASEMTPEGMNGGTGAESPFYSEEFFEDAIQRSEQQMEAVEAADYTSRWEWSGSLESGSGAGAGTGSGGMGGGTATVTAELSQTTENWESYLNELEDRDLPTPADTTFDLQVSSADGGLEGEMSWEASGESLYEGYSETMEMYESMLEGSEEVDADIVRHLANSGFRIAKMDASLDEEGGWSLEAGAAFGNGTALASAIETTEDIRVTQIVGEQEGGIVTTYVKTEGFVDETTEDAVRSREQVGDGTTVNMPGDWDRDFPEMDRQSAADYLGVELDEEDGSPLPGFGFVVALVALTVVAVAVGRRRE